MAALFPYDLWILFCGLITILLYNNWEKYLRFKRSGIKIKTPVPFLGNTARSTLRTAHIIDELMESYHAFPKERYIGFFQLIRPFIMLRDPQLIKQIAVRDVEHFTDHQSFVDEEIDSIFGCNVFALKGEKWRNMRSTMTPAFTSSKMKTMFHLMVESSLQAVDFLEEEVDKNSRINGKRYIELEMKNFCARYTSDVIATTSFGIKVDSLKHPENEFYLKGKDLTNFEGLKLFKLLAYLMFPKISSFFRIQVFSDIVTKYFKGLVLDTMKIREEQNIFRPDIIQILMEAKKGTLNHETDSRIENAGFATIEESKVDEKSMKHKWSDNELAAQAIGFLFAGFDTSSTFLSQIVHELAANPDVQVKLQEEIDRTLGEHGGKLSYDAMMKMKYLDMVVSESLRKSPPSILVDRICTKPYTFGPTSDDDNNSYKINPGESLWIPIYMMHHDEKYWPNPERFDPERFSDENKANIEPYTFIPFGVGARACIGSRFALMEVKVFIFHLYAKFNCVAGPRTQIPLKLKKGTFDLRPTDGYWIKVESRNDKI